MHKRRQFPLSRPAVAAAAQPAPVLGEFVADIEASLGEDFLKAAPVAEPKPAAPALQSHAPGSGSGSASGSEDGAADGCECGCIGICHESRARPVAAETDRAAERSGSRSTISNGFRCMGCAGRAYRATATARCRLPPIAPPPTAAAKIASPFGEDAGVDLAEMFGELKQDLEADVAAADEDPETHYNLGIAFREMGLLDEAIGELQKACQSFDHGHPFPQIMQTYTWLAQCFLEKGVPEAAVRWYEKALQVKGIDGETRVALNYELAAAYETVRRQTVRPQVLHGRLRQQHRLPRRSRAH